MALLCEVGHMEFKTDGEFRCNNFVVALHDAGKHDGCVVSWHVHFLHSMRKLFGQGGEEVEVPGSEGRRGIDHAPDEGVGGVVSGGPKLKGDVREKRIYLDGECGFGRVRREDGHVSDEDMVANG